MLRGFNAQVKIITGFLAIYIGLDAAIVFLNQLGITKFPFSKLPSDASEQDKIQDLLDSISKSRLKKL